MLFKRDFVLSIISLMSALLLSLTVNAQDNQIEIMKSEEASIDNIVVVELVTEVEIEIEKEKEEIKVASVGGSATTPVKSKDLGEFKLTAYCKCSKCCGKWSKVPGTASGAMPQANHTIAADKRFEFGTKLKINNTIYTVEDRGGAINGNHIDIYFDTHEQALAFGAQYSNVYLVN